MMGFIVVVEFGRWVALDVKRFGRKENQFYGAGK